MARAKKEVFNRTDVEFVATQAVALTLNNVVQAILNGNVGTSPGLGELLLHLNSGYRELIGEAVEQSKKIVETGEPAIAVEKLNTLQEIVSGKTK